MTDPFQNSKRFAVGLLISITLIVALNNFLPSYPYFAGQYTGYSNGESTPSTITIAPTVTNKYLVMRFGFYCLAYWVTYLVMYGVLENLSVLRIDQRLARVHFRLSIAATVLLLPVNRFIVLNPEIHYGARYMSDMYISTEITPDLMTRWNELHLFYEAVATPSFIGAVIMTVGGLAVFVRSIRKGTAEA
jgi:hypothetical protein